jgi:acyl carrier protein
MTRDESRRQTGVPGPSRVAAQPDLEVAPASRPVNAVTVIAHIESWLEARNLRALSDLNQTFHDAGFDSLHALELALYLEKKLDTRISETALFDCSTFASLTEYIVRRGFATEK